MRSRALALLLVALATSTACGQSEEDARSACRRAARGANQVVRDILRTMQIVLRGQRANVGIVETRLDQVKEISPSCDEFLDGSDQVMRACGRTVMLTRRAAEKFLRTIALVPPRDVRLLRVAFAATIPPALPAIRRESRTCFPGNPSPGP